MGSISARTMPRRIPKRSRQRKRRRSRRNLLQDVARCNRTQMESTHRRMAHNQRTHRNIKSVGIQSGQHHYQLARETRDSRIEVPCNGMNLRPKELNQQRVLTVGSHQPTHLPQHDHAEHNGAETPKPTSHHQHSSCISIFRGDTSSIKTQTTRVTCRLCKNRLCEERRSSCRIKP